METTASAAVTRSVAYKQYISIGEETSFLVNTL